MVVAAVVVAFLHMVDEPLMDVVGLAQVGGLDFHILGPHAAHLRHGGPDGISNIIVLAAMLRTSAGPKKAASIEIHVQTHDGLLVASTQ